MDASCVAAASSPRGSVDHWRAGSLSHADPFQGPARRHAKNKTRNPQRTHTQADCAIHAARRSHTFILFTALSAVLRPRDTQLRTVRTPRDTHDTRDTHTHGTHETHRASPSDRDRLKGTHTHKHTHEVVRKIEIKPPVYVYTNSTVERCPFLFIYLPRARAAAPPFGHRRYHDAGWVVGAKF